MITEKRVGSVVHFYNRLNVAVVKLDQGSLQVGDSVHFRGHTTDFHQRIDSMEIDHKAIQMAGQGQEFGLKVSGPVRENDSVLKPSA